METLESANKKCTRISRFTYEHATNNKRTDAGQGLPLIGPQPIPERASRQHNPAQPAGGGGTHVLLLDLCLLLGRKVVDDVEELADLLGRLALDHVRDRLASDVAVYDASADSHARAR
jgi:hypothetical protein